MNTTTKKAATLYGAWVVICVGAAFLGNTFAGHGEYGLSAHFVLTLTGLPFSLMSWRILPNGSVLATSAAGAIGFVQWLLVAEANARWESRRKSRYPK